MQFYIYDDVDIKLTQISEDSLDRNGGGCPYAVKIL